MIDTRASRFVAVGAVGFAVQMGVATALLASGVAPLLATWLAIEAAIVNNHAWHRRWAWRDRAAAIPWPHSLWRAHLGAGGTSLVVGLGTVAALSGVAAPLAAQVIAVALSAMANYWLADHFVFRAGGQGFCRDRSPSGPSVPSCGHGRLGEASLPAPGSVERKSVGVDLRFVGVDLQVDAQRDAHRSVVGVLILLALLSLPAMAYADGPSRAALASWDRYAAALARAREADRTRGVPAWATDDDPKGSAVMAALGRGEAHVTDRRLAGVEVDDATLEHWQGSVLLRGVSMEAIAERLRHPERHPTPRDVLALKVSDWSEGGHDLYLRLTRSLLVTATYDTWHRVRHRQVDGTRIESTSVSTRIEELHDAGTPKERRVSLAESRGFLWRMQSLWRFTATREGVVVTCESITLSRPVPFGLGLVSRPIITRVARESMTTAVRAWTR